MKNSLRLLAAAVLMPAFAIPAGARTMNLQGTTYDVDTVEHYVAGPAMKYSRLAIRSASNTFGASVLEIDMGAQNRPQIKVEVGRDSVNTAEGVTSVAKRKSDASRRYVAGINGDFFITSSFASQHPLGNSILGFPNVTSATEGKLISPDAIDYSSREKCFILTSAGEMFIDATDLSGTFSFPGKKSDMKIYHTNYPRTDTDIILYNSFFGGWTKTDNTGWEVAIELQEGESWALNRPVKAKVVSEPVQKGNSKIPANGAVISAGQSRTSQIEYIKKYQVGDEVILNLNVSLPKHGDLKPQNISEIIGGDVRILNQGNVTMAGDPDAIRFINTPTAKYQRSLIGFSQDQKKLVLCAVDNGIGGGGASYYDSADLMRELGCYDALDFDGGGSTLMYLRTPGIVNHLRDGSERAVGNGIYAIVNAPEDNTVRTIRFADHALNLPRYAAYKPVFYGYNGNGELISMDVKGVTLSAPEGLGEILEDGSLLASGEGCHALTATYNGTTATIAVTVSGSSEIRPRHTDVLIDNIRDWEAELVTEVNGKDASISPAAMTWISTDPTVATVTVDGKVKGLKNGTTILRGTLGEQVVEINLTVEIPTAAKMAAASLRKSADFTIKGTSINSAFTVSDTENGFSIGYRLSSTRSPYFTLTPVSPVFYSLPDALSFNISSTLGCKVIGNFRTNDGVSLRQTIDEVPAGTGTEVKFSFADLTDTGDLTATYPLTLTSLLVYPLSGKTATDYTLGITDMSLIYDKYDPAGVEEVIAGGADTNAPVEYYDITGRKIADPRPGNFYIRRQGNRSTKIIL